LLYLFDRYNIVEENAIVSMYHNGIQENPRLIPRPGNIMVHSSYSIGFHLTKNHVASSIIRESGNDAKQINNIYFFLSAIKKCILDIADEKLNRHQYQ